MKGDSQMDQQKTMQFMQIAMKYLPEAKAQLDQHGIELKMETIQPMLDLLLKVMNEAYELGKNEGSQSS
jgi:competence protein ComZ